MTFGCLESVDFVSFASTKGSLSILSAREILCIRAQIIGGPPCRDLCIHLFAQHKRLTTNVTNKGCVGTSHRVDFAKVELVVSLFFLYFTRSHQKGFFTLLSLSLSRCRFHLQSGRAWNAFCLPPFRARRRTSSIEHSKLTKRTSARKNNKVDVDNDWLSSGGINSSRLVAA